MATAKKTQQQPMRLRLWHVIVIVLLIALSVYMIIQFFEQQAILERQQKRLEELEQQQALLDEQLSGVNRELLAAGSPAYIERYLRKLGMIKDGEVMITITEVPQSTAP